MILGEVEMYKTSKIIDNVVKDVYAEFVTKLHKLLKLILWNNNPPLSLFAFISLFFPLKYAQGIPLHHLLRFDSQLRKINCTPQIALAEKFAVVGCDVPRRLCT